MSAVLSFHRGLFFAGLVLTLIVGIWGLVSYFRHRPPAGSFNSALLITEALFIIQGLAGATLFLGGRRPHDPLHWLYGILLVIVIPIAATYAGSHDQRRQSLVYGIAGLFMAGLTIRALTTA